LLHQVFRRLSRQFLTLPVRAVRSERSERNGAKRLGAIEHRLGWGRAAANVGKLRAVGTVRETRRNRAVTVRTSVRRELSVRSWATAVGGRHVRAKGLILRNVQGVRGSPDGDTAQRAFRCTSDSAVASKLHPVVAAVVAWELKAASGILDFGVVGRNGGMVAVVVDAGSTPGSDVAATTRAGTSVDDGCIRGVSASLHIGRTQLATRRQDARLLREVVAAHNTTRVAVVERALRQPSAGSVDFSIFVPHAGVAVRVLVAPEDSDVARAVR